MSRKPFLHACLAAPFPLLASASSASDVRQSQPDFEAAVGRMSTAPSYVLITVVDANNGVERTGCTEAPFLIGAILMERHIPPSRETIAEAQRIAAASLDHRFVFQDAAALRNVGFGQVGRQNVEACRLIRSGQSAFRGDRDGHVHPGRPAR